MTDNKDHFINLKKFEALPPLSDVTEGFSKI